MSEPTPHVSTERGTIRVGTSGWSYDHWRGVFYPDHLPAEGRLAHYATRFDTVEVNSTFYGLPKEETVLHWRESVPDGFVFAVKGSRYVTHIRRLRDVGDDVETLMWRLRPLGETLGPMLWQLPPSMKKDVRLLDSFLSILRASSSRDGRPIRHAIEFRDDSWLDDEVFATLSAHDAAIVNTSGEQLRTDFTPTASFVYVRFHGTRRYHGTYERPQLAPWERFLSQQAAQGRDCYAYFNNDAEGHAPGDAHTLLQMLGEP